MLVTAINRFMLFARVMLFVAFFLFSVIGYNLQGLIILDFWYPAEADVNLGILL